MKKMPCLFQRTFHGHDNATLLRDVTPGCEWVLAGEGVASRKWDGTACMVKDGILYKRYDAKRGKAPPPGAIPCDNPDPVTGHHPHWLAVDPSKPEDKWHVATWNRWLRVLDGLASGSAKPRDGTYELVGPHFNGNPEGFVDDCLVPHGHDVIEVDRSFDGIREYLAAHAIEGIVFAHPDGRMCKIRRNDYGLPWGAKGGKK
jgi:hypothetical protein